MRARFFSVFDTGRQCTVCRVKLAGQWETMQQGLPLTWSDVTIRITLEDTSDATRALALLTSAQPLVTDDGSIAIRVTRSGEGVSPQMARRALDRLDKKRIHAELTSGEAATAGLRPVVPGVSLAASWDEALSKLPSDWSDLLGEVELNSSDWIDEGAVHLGPINPRRQGTTLIFQFRSSSKFGYGASIGMVRRCLERCDNAGMSGAVSVVRVLSDTHPVGTQGPVWQIAGKTV